MDAIDGAGMIAAVRSRVAPATRTTGGLAMLLLLAGCTMNERVEVTNATDQLISVSYDDSFKNRKYTATVMLAPGEREQITPLDRTIWITVGTSEKYYVQTPVPDAYMHRVFTFGPFMTRMAHASFKKDGCLHLVPVDAEAPDPACLSRTDSRSAPTTRRRSRS